MDDADGRGEAQFHGAAAHFERIFRIVESASDHLFNVDVKFGVLGQKLKFLVQNLEAFLRYVVGSHVIDRNLQVLEAGLIQTANAVRGQQISVGDHARYDAVFANSGDDLVKLGVQQRLATAQSNDGGSQVRKPVDTLEHDAQRDRLRNLVVFVTVGAGQIAAAYGNDVGQDWMIGRSQPLQDHHQLARAAMHGCPTSPETEAQICHSVLRGPFIRAQVRGVAEQQPASGVF